MRMRPDRMPFPGNVPNALLSALYSPTHNREPYEHSGIVRLFDVV